MFWSRGFKIRLDPAKQAAGRKSDIITLPKVYVLRTFFFLLITYSIKVDFALQ